MEVLFVFMKWVASFSHVDEETGSKMDLQNLATVITPNILYARSKDPTRDESFLAIRAVHELLEHQDELFQVPDEVHLIMQDQELLNSNVNEITSKDSAFGASDSRSPKENNRLTHLPPFVISHQTCRGAVEAQHGQAAAKRSSRRTVPRTGGSSPPSTRHSSFIILHLPSHAPISLNTYSAWLTSIESDQQSTR